MTDIDTNIGYCIAQIDLGEVLRDLHTEDNKALFTEITDRFNHALEVRKLTRFELNKETMEAKGL